MPLDRPPLEFPPDERPTAFGVAALGIAAGALAFVIAIVVGFDGWWAPDLFGGDVDIALGPFVAAGLAPLVVTAAVVAFPATRTHLIAKGCATLVAMALNVVLSYGFILNLPFLLGDPG